MPTPRPGTCERLRNKASSGDRRALGTARRLDCDWLQDFAAPAGLTDWCKETPVSFTSASGKAVSFTARRGPGCPPRDRTPTPGQTAWRAKFGEAARATARGETFGPGSGAAPCGPTDPSCFTPADRQRTVVKTPQGNDQARYGLIEAEDLIPSHNPMTFSPDPRYPANVQEREYQFDRNEQDKVRRNAQHLDPAILLHRSPTAVDGPPLVTSDGCVLGGNGRTQMIQRAYGEFEDRANAYKAALACEAGTFGFTKNDVGQYKQPVLVRFIEGTKCDDDPRELAQAVRRYNEGLTNAIDSRALGVSQSRQMSANTMNLFGQLVSGERTLRDVMREDPRHIIRALETDGVITRENRTKMVLESGHLTEDAKGQIEAMFLGRVLGNAERVRATAPSVLGKLEKAVPYLTAVAGRNPAFDLTHATQEAVDLLNRAQASGSTVEQTIQQRDIFGGQPRKEAMELARMLSGLSPNTVRDRFQAWAKEADFDPAQTMIGTRPPTADEAFRALTTAPRVGRALFVGSVVNQETNPNKPPIMARVVAMHDPDKHPEIKPGKARIEFLNGPMRGKRQIAVVADLGDVVG